MLGCTAEEDAAFATLVSCCKSLSDTLNTWFPKDTLSNAIFSPTSKLVKEALLQYKVESIALLLDKSNDTIGLPEHSNHFKAAFCEVSIVDRLFP